MATRKVTSSNNVISQWVRRVTRYSSQYNSDSWSANQVIGSPRVYPNYGDKHGAWATSTCDANQFVELEYEKAVYVTGVDIYETYHAGGTKRVLAKDETGKWRTLWETDDLKVIKSSRIFSPPLHWRNKLTEIKGPSIREMDNSLEQMENQLFWTGLEQIDLKTKFLRVEIDCTAAGTWVELDAIQMHGTEFNFEPPPSMEKLAEDFGQLVNNKEFSDVQFLIQKRVIYGHRNILSVRSDYFKAMFRSKMKECEAGQPIEIMKVTYDSFMAIMHYLYTNKLPNEYSCLTLTDVWRAADTFGIEGLTTLVSCNVIQKIDSSNVVEVYLSATNYLPLIEELKNSCLSYMSSHMNEIVNSSSFVDLPQQTMLEIVQLTTARLSI